MLAYFFKPYFSLYFIQTASELDSIPGIGEKTKTDLLKHFKSLKRISLATEAELQEVVGKSRSSVVYNYFRAKLSL